MITKSCLTCSKEFKVKPYIIKKEGWGKFCSSQCRGIADRGKKKVVGIFTNCLNCGVNFRTYPYYIKKGANKFCSKKCYTKSGQVLRNCVFCSKSFLGHKSRVKVGWGKYCSKKCMTNSQVGKRLSPKTEFKKGLTPWNKGKEFLQIRGENSHWWKGGITKLNHQIRSCIEYINWRTANFERDNYACIECGKTGRGLQVNHKKQFSLILEENNIKTFKDALDCAELWDTDNGETLCKGCHSVKTKEFMRLNWTNQYANTIN